MQALSTATVRHDATKGAANRAGAPVDPWWIVGLLRRGWRVLGAATLGGLLVGGLVAMLAIPSTWESEALVVADVEPDPANPWASQNALSEGAELMGHPSTLLRLRERVGHEGPVEALGRQIEVEADRNAGVIRVTAQADSRDGAVGLAEAAVENFLEVRRENERARLEERLRLTRVELAAAETQLAEARAEYDAFRTEHGIADLAAQQEAAIAELAELQSDAAQEEVAAVSAAARMEVLRREARRLPAMTTSSASSTDLVRTSLASARAELAQARARYTDEHPTVMGLEARVASLEAEARRGTRTVQTDSTASANPIRDQLEGNAALAAADEATARQRREGLERLAELARDRVRSLSGLEGQASLLLAAVRIGEEQAEALRRDIAQLEDGLTEPPTGFRVAAPASIPDSPLRARGRVLAWGLPPLLALLVAFGFLFWRERGARTQTPTEVAWWGHAPVIGTTEWPRDPAALDLLVGELEDLGTYAAGRTLVVPATPGERDLATEFAAKLAEAPWLAAGVLDVDEAPRSEPPPAHLIPEDLRVPGHRPTLPMPLTVTPAPVDASDAASKVRRATVRLMMEGAPGASAQDGAPERAVEAEAEGKRTRKVSGRFMLSAPTVLVGPDVRVGNIVRVGDEPAVSTAAAVWTPGPAAQEARTIHVSGTVDDGRGAPTPFEVRADAPVKQDAVLMLAMRILGDVVDPETSRPTMIDARPPRHRPADATESRAPHEQAVALAWTGALEGPTLRRAARLADRVIVLLREGSLSPADLATLQTRLGREDAIGFLVVGATESSVRGPDRVGPVAEFWTTRKRLPG